MMEHRIFLMGLVLSLFLGAPLYAAENATEKDLAYRRATLEALVAESQRTRTYLRRDLSQQPYFQTANDTPLSIELEPVKSTTCIVVAA